MRAGDLAGRLSIAIAMLALLGVAPAGAPPTSPKDRPAAPSVPGYERIEVRLAQFDVVVRDKSGKIVSGLGREDFSVVEDGVPLEIVAVDECGIERPAPGSRASATAEAPPASPAPAPAPAAEAPEKRSFVIVFDALGDTTALRMSQAKRAATQFVRTHLTPDDVAAVYQLDLSLRPLSGITSNREELTGAIERVAWMPASSLEDEIAESVVGSAMASGKDYFLERLQNQAATAGMRLDWQREHVYATLNDLAPLFEGLPGRRVLVLASPGFPMTTAPDRTSQTGGFTPKFRDLIRSLARYGVTVYSLDIGSDDTLGDVGEPIDWRVAVGKLGLDENVLGDLGLDRSLGAGSAGQRRQFLGVIAGETGGRLLTATDLGRDFDAIQEESTRYYRVACRVPVTADANRYRKTVVTVRRAGSTVTARRGRYSDIVPLDRPRSASVATAVDSVDRYRPLSARGVALALPAPDAAKVPLAVVVEALGPIDVATDAKGEGSLEVEFRLVARAAGEVVDRYERSFTAKVKRDGVGPIRRAFRVEGRLALVPGIYELQGTVRLVAPPQLATWTSEVAVPPRPRGPAPAFVGVALSSESESASPLLSRPAIAPEADALLLKPGVRILPATGPQFDAGTPVLVLFWIKGLPAAAGEVPKFDLGVRLDDAGGKAADAPSSLLYFAAEPSGGYRGLVKLDLSTLAPGAYALRLTAASKEAGIPVARVSAPLIVEARAIPPAPAAPEPAPGVTSSASP